MPNVIDLSNPQNRVSGLIINNAIHIHKKLGPGLLESAYEEALIYFLVKEGLSIERQKTIPLKIDDLIISAGFRADIIVEGTVICEVKSVEKLIPLHEAQLMTYLKLSGKKIGLLINFGERILKDGLKRIVL
jgi:GxxExxY protein